MTDNNKKYIEFRRLPRVLRLHIGTFLPDLRAARKEAFESVHPSWKEQKRKIEADVLWDPRRLEAFTMAMLGLTHPHYRHLRIPNELSSLNDLARNALFTRVAASGSGELLNFITGNYTANACEFVEVAIDCAYDAAFACKIVDKCWDAAPEKRGFGRTEYHRPYLTRIFRLLTVLDRWPGHDAARVVSVYKHCVDTGRTSLRDIVYKLFFETAWDYDDFARGRRARDALVAHALLSRRQWNDVCDELRRSRYHVAFYPLHGAVLY